MKATLIGVALALTTTAALAGLAGATPQRGGGFNQGPAMDVPGNTPYDGRFVFIRLRYSFGYGGGRMRGDPPWSHDYPRGEVHFTKILNEITYVRPRLDELEHPGARRPGARQLPGRLHGGAGLLVDDRQGMRELSRRAARRAVDRDRRRQAPNLAFVLRDSQPEGPEASPDLRSVDGPDLLGHLRGQRPEQRLLAIANVHGDISE
jgi:hypothetical protein